MANLLLNLILDVFLDLQQLDLTLHVYQHTPQTLFHAQRFEYCLALLWRDIEIPTDNVGHGTGITHCLKHLLHSIRRNTGLLS